MMELLNYSEVWWYIRSMWH